MTNEQMVEGLLSLKSAPGFDALEFLLTSKLNSIRDRLESDPSLTDFNLICMVRGEAGAYRLLLEMFEKHLALIKEQQDHVIAGYNPDSAGNI